MPERIDLTGQTFGQLEAIEDVGSSKGRSRLWRCRCTCGLEVVVRTASLRSGATTSCGCATSNAISEGRRTHGQSKTPLYRRWLAMRTRTGNPKADNYGRYGGIGIKVCERWESFENFAADMGPTFREDLTLDRIDPMGNYEPSNCRWITNPEQQRNKRDNRPLTLHGQTKTMAEWCEVLGLKYFTVASRLNRLGWAVERALSTGADPEALARWTEAR